MCNEDGLGVDTGAADQAGAQVTSLAQRYASISVDLRVGMTQLSAASTQEMAVMSAALDYSANVMDHLTRLQAFTGALGASAQQAAATARHADSEIGTGLGSIN
ncbi:MAG: hypothetical protein M3313_11420, partial [Actinomycetota bacterium]|nr:hypothetical protein [Actinomycetota bacterium]